VSALAGEDHGRQVPALRRYDSPVPVPSATKAWSEYFIRRVERTRTTWLLRLIVLTAMASLLWMTSAWWTAAVGRSLVCESIPQRSDAILVDNFDPEYRLFERARELRGAGLAPRVLVPIPVDPDTQTSSEVARRVAEVMASVSHLGTIEIVPIRQVEPITLNAARDIGRFLRQHRLHSIIVVTPLFRSRRAALIYRAVLGADGVTLSCTPGASTRDIHTWPASWHGIQNVLEQWLKLQYYRLWVLPFGVGDH
jgi:hypothetical protein